MDLIINTDGACRGNPGPSSYAFVIKNSSGVILHQESGFIGRSTNNLAEYTAVKKALEYLKDYCADRLPLKVEIITDSKLMAEQLSGNYRVKDIKIKKLFDVVKGLEIELGQFFYRNVGRGQNYIADKLANLALDKEGY